MILILKGFAGPMGLFMLGMAGLLIYGAAGGVKAIKSKNRISMRHPIGFIGAFSLISIIIWGILITDAVANVPEAEKYKAFAFSTNHVFGVLAFAVLCVIILYGIQVVAGNRANKEK